MSDISKFLQDGIDRMGWATITEAAEEIGIERTFLSRLLKGDPPRRTLGGSRSNVEPDERYLKMATKLKLGDDFLEAVSRELKARAPKPRKPSARPDNEAGDYQSLTDDEALRDRYPELWEIVEAQGDLEGESALLKLAEDCLTGLEEADIWKRRVRSYHQPEHFFEAKRHDRLGILPGVSRSAPSVEARTCRRIAEAVTDDIGPKTIESSRSERIEIASFFFELAYCRFH